MLERRGGDNPGAKVPSRARRKPERVGEILRAAFEEFVLHGYAAARLEDVAVRAGMTKGTIYFHFRNKEDVFMQMVRELSKPMRLKSEAFLKDAPDDAVEFMTGYLTFAHSSIFNERFNREILRLLIAEATRFPDLADEYFSEFIEPVFSRLRESLTVAASKGQVRQSPAIEFPNLILSPVLALHVLLLVFADRKAVDPARHLAAAKDLLLYGLLPRGEGEPGVRTDS